MNHLVPDFESNEDYLIPELHKKSSMGGGNKDIMELLWHNGQVVMQSQNKRSGGNIRSSSQPHVQSAAATTTSKEVRSSVVDRETGPSDLFMHEDEMASWLHYPTDENSLESYLFNNDLLYPTPPLSTPVTAPSATPPVPQPPPETIPSTRPPVPSFQRVEKESRPLKYTNFGHFSRPIKNISPRLGHAKMGPAKTLPEPSTLVTSNDAPSTALESRASRVSNKQTPTNIESIGVASTSSAGREIEKYEMSVTSSLGSGSGGTQPLPKDDRKRKIRDTDEHECHSEDAEFEYHDAKKQSHGGSTSTKRSRAAEVHNLSERKRRDRINEKMKALQELIPRSNKSDKASMLDEAIEYLKSLQMQVQMMSMGCSMVPMMFPGVQQYVPPMAMGMGMGMGMMGMGMGMGMDLGMNRTMIPYPAILPGPSLPNPSASQAANMPAPMMSSFPQHNQNQPRVPNAVDPFQQYIGLRQTQIPFPHNQGGIPPIAMRPSLKDATNPDQHQTG